MPKSNLCSYSNIKNAIKKGKMNTVQNIITNDNTAIKLQDKHHNSLLHLAVRYDDPDIARLLLEASSNVNAKNKNEETPLHIAVKYPNLDIIMLLLDNRANVNAKNKNEETALHTVFAHPNTSATRAKQVADITKLLIERVANINEEDGKGYTPLSHVIDFWLNNFDAIKLLVKHGADINKEDKKGNTILHHVVKKYKSCEDAVYLLGLPKKDYKLEYTNYIELLLKLGANINATNKNGETILHAASHYSSKDSDMIKLLLSYNANPSITDKQGKYPMNNATSSKIFDILYDAYFSCLTLQSDLAAEYQNVNNTSYAEDCGLMDENETEFGLSGRVHSNRLLLKLGNDVE